jgi:TolA-binding protein
MRQRLIASALFVSLAAGAAEAQTYVPGQTQQMLNQEQLDIQSQQLQQLQRQNNQALQQADPAVRMQAAQAQMQINRQTAETNAARMQAPSADPADLNARLQANSAAIQQIRPPVAP